MPAAVQVETGGLRIGSSYMDAWNFSWPLATLQIEPDALQIHASLFGLFRQVHRLPREEVRRVSVERRIFGHGIRIEHNCSDQPEFILFWSFSADRVLQKLLKGGYQGDINNG